MKFKEMSTCPPHEGVPFLILRHGNDAANFLVQQVQWFEGNIYPDALDFCVDYGDRITDAVGWCDLVVIRPPATIQHHNNSEAGDG